MLKIRFGSTSGYCDGVSPAVVSEAGGDDDRRPDAGRPVLGPKRRRAWAVEQGDHQRASERRSVAPGHVRSEAARRRPSSAASSTRSPRTCRAWRSASTFRSSPRWPTSSRSFARSSARPANTRIIKRTRPITRATCGTPAGGRRWAAWWRRCLAKAQGGAPAFISYNGGSPAISARSISRSSRWGAACGSTTA